MCETEYSPEYLLQLDIEALESATRSIRGYEDAIKNIRHEHERSWLRMQHNQAMRNAIAAAARWIQP